MSYQGAHSGADIDDAVGVVKGEGTGLVVKTATGEGVRRSIVGSDNVEVTNGDGVLGDINLDLTAAVIASLSRADSAIQGGGLTRIEVVPEGGIPDPQEDGVLYLEFPAEVLH